MVGDFEANDDNLFTCLNEVGGGSVHANHSAISFSFDDVGLETGTRGVAYNQDALSLPQAHSFHEIGVDGDATYVGEIGLRDGGFVDLGSEEGAHAGNRAHKLPEMMGSSK